MTIPSDFQNKPFRVSPIKLRNSTDSAQISSFDEASSKIMQQWPILLEGGMDVVADCSAVDGINFIVKYELTSDDSRVKTMQVNKNPCRSLDSRYQMDVGCRCPASVDCKGMPTCDCKPATQICRFNQCSEALFQIPANLQQYINQYDDGAVVKKFINQASNLKEDSALRDYCTNLQSNSGDFTAYCYDYNDVGSSPWLRTPYKMKVTYSELQQ